MSTCEDLRNPSLTLALATLLMAAAMGPAATVLAQDTARAGGPATAGGSAPAGTQAPADTPAPINPFADFETHHLSNGVKVWFKRLEGAANVSVSAGVPVGADADPRGKEQLAHFTEHMLFGDHNGRTEQEIKDAVEGLGGRRNGMTYRDHTWYYVTIAREHGLFAIEWLAGIMSPHAMEPEVVERGRQPVENEIGARPREFFDHLGALLSPEWLRPPDFYEREFGIENQRDLIPDYWTSLRRITPDDLRGFYDRYYAPGAMTVTIVGDLDRDEALALAERTFGQFPERQVNRFEVAVTDPGRGRAEYSWGFQSTVRYQSRHKLFGATDDDFLHALFVRDLLGRRLNQRLRYGERKAVYGASASLVMRGPAAYLQVSSRIDEDDYDFATGIIAEEIEHLRSASLDAAAFEADRAAVVERLRASNQTAESLNFWTRSYFYDPDVFADFPDLVSFYENVTQEQVAAFAQAAFVDTREVRTVTRTQPLSQGMIVVGVVALIWLTLRGLARMLTAPIAMREIRYMARFRLPILLRVAYTVGLVAALLVLMVFGTAGFSRLATTWIDPVDSYLIQTAATAAMGVVLLAGLCLIYASSPRKILLFNDHLRIKSRAWRSRVLLSEDIAEISLRRFPEIWLSRRLFGGPPHAFGLRRPAIYVRPLRGRSYFFRTRNTDEMVDVLNWWRGPSVK